MTNECRLQRLPHGRDRYWDTLVPELGRIGRRFGMLTEPAKCALSFAGRSQLLEKRDVSINFGKSPPEVQTDAQRVAEFGITREF
jgi:hypothetical protein